MNLKSRLIKMEKKVIIKTTSSKKKNKKQNKAAVVKSNAAAVKQKNTPMKRASSSKRYFNVTAQKYAGKDVVCVEGRECFRSIAATNSTTVDPYHINPLNSTLFTRLPNYGSMYEKFMFEEVSLEYEPMCPVTLSGAVGLMFDPDAGDSLAPGDFPDMLNNQHSNSSSLGEKLIVSLSWKRDQMQWYYNSPTTATDTIGTLRTTCPARAYVLQGLAAVGDLNRFGGYLYVKYKCYFCDYHPPTSSGFTILKKTSPTTPQTYTPGVLADIYDTITGVFGGYYTQSTETIPNRNELLNQVLSLGKDVKLVHQWLGTLRAFFGAAVTSGKPTKPTSHGLKDLLGYKPSSCDFIDGKWYYRNGEDKQLAFYDHEIKSPSTAGDIYLRWITWDPNGNTVVLDFLTVNVNTTWTTDLTVLINSAAVNAQLFVEPQIASDGQRSNSTMINWAPIRLPG